MASDRPTLSWSPTAGTLVKEELSLGRRPRRHLSVGRAPSSPSTPEFPLGIHESALDPRPKRAIASHRLTVEQLRQHPLDALVDVTQFGLLLGDFPQAARRPRSLHHNGRDGRAAELVTRGRHGRGGNDAGRRE